MLKNGQKKVVIHHPATSRPNEFRGLTSEKQFSSGHFSCITIWPI